MGPVSPHRTCSSGVMPFFDSCMVILYSWARYLAIWARALKLWRVLNWGWWENHLINFWKKKKTKKKERKKRIIFSELCPFPTLACCIHKRQLWGESVLQILSSSLQFCQHLCFTMIYHWKGGGPIRDSVHSYSLELHQNQGDMGSDR